MKFLLFGATALISSVLSGPVLADNIAYEGSGSGVFGTIDLNTGAFAAIGPGFGFTPAGLASYNDVLYTTSYDGNGTLYSVNTVTGTLTTLGSSGIYYQGGIGSTNSGLYGIGSNEDLYSINPTNGAATDVGPTGASLGAWRDLSAGGSQLYFGNGPNLYSINTATGAATLVGAFGTPASIGAMVYENSTLFGGDQGRGLIDTINLSTGVATPIAGATAGDVWGLAPLSTTPVPIPASLFLFGSGLAGFAFFRLRRAATPPARTA
jgi:hypothetical protein